jgi:hypothetical protein
MKRLEIVLCYLLKGVSFIIMETFVLVGHNEIIEYNSLEVNVLEPEEVIVEDLGAQEFAPHANSPSPSTFSFYCTIPSSRIGLC